MSDIPAFPVHPGVQIDGPVASFQGMTLRDYFAAAALQGLLARMSERDYASSVDAEDWSFATGDAFRIADDMLRSRKDERDA